MVNEKPKESAVETQLRDGSYVRVTLRFKGEGNTEEIARDALGAAIGEVQKYIDKPKVEAGDIFETGIVGQSAPMRDLFKMLDRIRNSNATVLVLGENGTGKELVAKSIHEMSRRADKPFVATNCSAFNDNLLESELFGHKRGAFTGAVGDKQGLFQVADNGTFFLDEVGDMSPALQVKLLRVLQEGTFMPVGATQYKKVDVRIIAATNRDLEKMVQEGTFRQDLYYRLHVVQLRVPPLRERKDDIPRLVNFFIQRLSERDGRDKSLSQRAMNRLMEHDWPGNVRELENEIERLWVLSGTDSLIGDEHLTPTLTRRRPSQPAERDDQTMPIAIEGQTLPEAVAALERRMISDGLRATKGNKTRTAQALGISRRNLIRKVQSYNLEDSK